MKQFNYWVKEDKSSIFSILLALKDFNDSKIEINFVFQKINP